MTADEIAERMTLSQYVEHAIVSKTPLETVEMLVSRGMVLVESTEIDGKMVYFLDHGGING